MILKFLCVDCLPSLNGSSVVPCENASLLVDAVCKIEEFYDTTPIALAIEQHIETDEGKTVKHLNMDEFSNADRLNILNTQECETAFEKVCEGKPRNQTESCSKMKKVLEDIYGSFTDKKENKHITEDKFCESRLKQLAASCAPQLVPSVSFNDKIQQFPSASPQCQKRRSAVIRLSFKRKSKDGEEISEICKSTCSLIFSFYYTLA